MNNDTLASYSFRLLNWYTENTTYCITTAFFIDVKTWLLEKTINNFPIMVMTHFWLPTFSHKQQCFNSCFPNQYLWPQGLGFSIRLGGGSILTDSDELYQQCMGDRWRADSMLDSRNVGMWFIVLSSWLFELYLQLGHQSSKVSLSLFISGAAQKKQEHLKDRIYFFIFLKVSYAIFLILAQITNMKRVQALSATFSSSLWFAGLHDVESYSPDEDRLWLKPCQSCSLKYKKYSWECDGSMSMRVFMFVTQHLHNHIWTFKCYIIITMVFH